METNNNIFTGFAMRRCIFICVVFMLMQSRVFADQCRITDIRFWQSPEEAQVVIDLSDTPKVSPIGNLSDGTAFFDVEGCSFRPGRQNYPLNNLFLQYLTVQERIRGAVRILFKPGNGVIQQTFVLPKNPSKPSRIVIFLQEPLRAQEARRAQERLEVNRLKAGNVKIVVIDPGHGGEDPGARHDGIIEKNYVLGMGTLLKSYFDQDPHYRAVMTRTGDYIIPLNRRSQIAEHLTADVFVSIHANYNRKRAIQGIEVYFESPHGAVGEAERLVAESENQQDAVGGVATSQMSGGAAKSDIVQKQASTMFKSRQLAEKVGARMARAVPGLYLRGVKRAGFKVLHSMAMPSILVELGYMSNPNDAAILKNAEAQKRLSQAIYSGVRDFLEGKIQEGYDVSYFQYFQQVEAAKRAQAEKQRIAKERRAKVLARSRPYKTKKGDTVASIAGKFKVKVAELRELNNFGKKRQLKAGETIRIP